MGILFSSKEANYKTFTLRLESTVGIFKNTRTEKKKSAYKKEKGIVYGTDYELYQTGTNDRIGSTIFYRNRSEEIRNWRDKYIPMILGGTGIVVCGIYVVATCDLWGVKNIARAVFTAIIQGILVAGLSNYVNQLIKQSGKTE